MFVYAGNLYLTQPGGGGPSPARWPPPLPCLPAVVMASMGLVATLAACAAQAATAAHNIVLLNVHLSLLALLLAGQVCLTAAVAASSSDRGRVVPDDGRRFSADGGGDVVHLHDSNRSGGDFIAGGSTLRHELKEVLLAYKWADAAALVVEVLTLVLGCMLHSAYMRADERAEDLEEGLADPSTPLLTSSRRRGAPRFTAAATAAAAGGGRTSLPPRVTRDDPWSTRMREQYGLDTSMLSYNPQAQLTAADGVGASAAGPGGAQQRGGGGEGSRCVIS